jgi:hypothetical protein
VKVELNKEKIWYVYIDFTNEESPRPFYIGKGLLKRVQKIKRNIVWQHMTEKYGQNRHIIFFTNDELTSLDVERFFIKEYNTFRGWGANLTEGGEGASGYRYIHSPESKQKMSELRKGENNPFYGKSHSLETKNIIKQKISEMFQGENNPNYGKKASIETKQKLSEANIGKNNPNYGKTPSTETKEKMSKAHKGRIPWNKGVNNKLKYSNDIILQVKNYKNNNLPTSEISKLMNIPKSTVLYLCRKEVI